MQGHGVEKFKDAGLLASSALRPWSMISAEVRSHSAGEIEAFRPVNAEITMILNSPEAAITSRASGGVTQVVPAHAMTTWLCPAGICEEATRLSGDIPEVLHVYLPHHAFVTMKDMDGLEFLSGDLRYQAAASNPVVQRILLEVVSELRGESFGGGLRIDALTCTLIGALALDHSENPGSGASLPRMRGGLDRVRLHRVVDYIEANIYRDLTIAELAGAANISAFHFARAFKVTMGRAPHMYVAQRRLDIAKQLLAYGKAGLIEIAAICRFSSQANFTKAFKRATGFSPGRYRAMAVS